MPIVPYFRFDLVEPSGGSLKIFIVGALCKFDFQTCARRFLRICLAELNHVMHIGSTLVVVDAHCAIFQI